MTITLRFGEAPASCRLLDTATRAAIRRCLADEVERLLGILDGLEVDPDLEEPADDEPSLGWASSGVPCRDGTLHDDREEDAGDDR